MKIIIVRIPVGPECVDLYDVSPRLREYWKEIVGRVKDDRWGRGILIVSCIHNGTPLPKLFVDSFSVITDRAKDRGNLKTPALKGVVKPFWLHREDTPDWGMQPCYATLVVSCALVVELSPPVCHRRPDKTLGVQGDDKVPYLIVWNEGLEQFEGYESLA